MLARARDAGVGRIITVGTDFASSEAAITLAERNRGMVFASVGIHPHEATHADERAVARLEELALPASWRSGRRGLITTEFVRRATQKSVFAAQIGIALRAEPAGRDPLPGGVRGLPAHSERTPEGLRGVAHCFAGDRGRRRRWRRWAFSSPSGTLTYPNAGDFARSPGFLRWTIADRDGLPLSGAAAGARRGGMSRPL